MIAFPRQQERLRLRQMPLAFGVCIAQTRGEQGNGTKMSIKASIYHLTHYKYDNPVVLSPQIVRLKPAAHSKTKVLSHLSGSRRRSSSSICSRTPAAAIWRAPGA
jgi:hypothetical protein